MQIFFLDIPLGEVAFTFLATHILSLKLYKCSHNSHIMTVPIYIVLSMSFINEYIQFC